MSQASGVRFSARAEIISLRHGVQIGSEAHKASYPTGTGDKTATA